MSEAYKRQVTAGIAFAVAIIAARYREYWLDDFSSVFPWLILALIVCMAGWFTWAFRQVRKNDSEENKS